jgi:hypothetical protein
MFAARRIATSLVPRVALTVRPSVAVPTARKAFATTSVARFLSTNALEQKRATVQRKDHYKKKRPKI